MVIGPAREDEAPLLLLVVDRTAGELVEAVLWPLVAEPEETEPLPVGPTTSEELPLYVGADEAETSGAE